MTVSIAAQQLSPTPLPALKDAGADTISIIVPAFNEEKYLGRTLDHIHRAIAYFEKGKSCLTEIIVVDNHSTDHTASIAYRSGATVISEAVRNISRVRNAGALAARGAILVFIDADTLIPDDLLWRISQAMRDPACSGGAVDTRYHPASSLLGLYLRVCRGFGRLPGMPQGMPHFCRRSIYLKVGGYNEGLYISEDVDFYWRLKHLAKKQGQKVCFLDDVQAIPSSRRFDQWPLWKSLILTNPALAWGIKWREAWNGWYQTPPR